MQCRSGLMKPDQKQELVLEERQQREIEGDPDRQPNPAISQRQNQEKIGSEYSDGQKRQKLGLAVAVKEQTRDHQPLDLQRSERREIIHPKYDRYEYAELPRCEGHAAPSVMSGYLTPPPDRVQPEPRRQPGKLAASRTAEPAPTGLSQASPRFLDVLVGNAFGARPGFHGRLAILSDGFLHDPTGHSLRGG